MEECGLVRLLRRFATVMARKKECLTPEGQILRDELNELKNIRNQLARRIFILEKRYPALSVSMQTGDVWLARHVPVLDYQLFLDLGNEHRTVEGLVQAKEEQVRAFELERVKQINTDIPDPDLVQARRVRSRYGINASGRPRSGQNNGG